jgi:hypothetical protein
MKSTSLYSITILWLFCYASNGQDFHMKGLVTYQARNLNTAVFRDGTPIEEAKSAVDWIKFNSEKKPAYCYYEFRPENGKIYGKLYNQWVISSQKEIAPEGWHLPWIYEIQEACSRVKPKEENVKYGRNYHMTEFDYDAFPSDLNIYDNDRILPQAASIISDQGIFKGIPYLERPEYKWWTGGWWIKTEFKNKGYLAGTVLTALEPKYGGPFKLSYNNNGFGYSIICFKDYPEPEISKAESKQMPTPTKNTADLSIESRQLEKSVNDSAKFVAVTVNENAASLSNTADSNATTAEMTANSFNDSESDTATKAESTKLTAVVLPPKPPAMIRSDGILTYKTENLDTDQFTDGTKIAFASSSEEWKNYDAGQTPAYCYYKFNKNKGHKFGKIYNYWAVSSNKGLIPKGWHLPNIYEFKRISGKTNISPEILMKNEEVYNSDIFSPFHYFSHISGTDNLFKAEDLAEISGSFCNNSGHFKFQGKSINSNNDKERDTYSGGGWWTSNKVITNDGKIFPIVYTIINSDNIRSDYEYYSPKSANFNISAANQGDGYYVLLIQDYPEIGSSARNQIITRYKSERSSFGSGQVQSSGNYYATAGYGSGRTIYTGARGGKYYLTNSGRKVYIANPARKKSARTSRSKGSSSFSGYFNYRSSGGRGRGRR